jgi:quinol monooxygenase YgiN
VHGYWHACRLLARGVGIWACCDELPASCCCSGPAHLSAATAGAHSIRPPPHPSHAKISSESLEGRAGAAGGAPAPAALVAAASHARAARCTRRDATTAPAPRPQRARPHLRHAAPGTHAIPAPAAPHPHPQNMQALSSRARGQQAGSRRQRPGCARQRCAVLCAIKQKAGQEVVCNKTLVSKAESKQQVMQLCQDMEAFAKQAMRDRSSGLLEYSCVQDRWEDNVFHIWERFDSNANMAGFMGNDRQKQFMQQVRARWGPRPRARPRAPASPHRRAQRRRGAGAPAAAAARRWVHSTPQHTTLVPAQVQPMLESPIGMSMYQYQDGQLSSACLAEGGLLPRLQRRRRRARRRTTRLLHPTRHCSPAPGSAASLRRQAAGRPAPSATPAGAVWRPEGRRAEHAR